MWLSFVCFFCVFFVFSFRVIYVLVCLVLCSFLATMSFAGYLLVRFNLSAFPPFFSDRVPVLAWFGYVYLVTKAGLLVADRLM